MKPQTLYRGGENKKEKISKAEKVWNVIQKEKRRALAMKTKKEATS